MLDLLKLRNLDHDAKQVVEAPIRRRGNSFNKVISKNTRAGVVEARSKTSYNMLNMALVALLVGVSLAASPFAPPMWALWAAVGVGGGAVLANFIGVLIETNRDQSQSNTITRGLYKKVRKGVDIGQGVHQSKDDNSSKAYPSRHILTKVNQAAKKKVNGGQYLENFLRKDNNATKKERLLKTIYGALYVAGSIIFTAGVPYLAWSLANTFYVGLSLFATAFIVDSVAADYEATRNSNQTIGLTLNEVGNINNSKTASDTKDAPSANIIPKFGSIKKHRQPIAKKIITERMNPDSSPALLQRS